MKRYRSLYEFQSSSVMGSDHQSDSAKNKSDFYLAPADSTKSVHTEPEWQILDLTGAEWADDRSVVSDMMDRGMLQGKSPDEVTIQRKSKDQIVILDNETEEVVARVRLASRYT